jgi:hypothetical protein
LLVCFLLAAEVQGQVVINFDYRYDTTGFFAKNGQAKEALSRAGAFFQSSLNDQLSAITPSASNSWNAYFLNPTTGGLQTAENLNVAANTLTIFVGARSMGTQSLAQGGYGGLGYYAGASDPFVTTLVSRGQTGVTTGSHATDFAPWGGSISFNKSVSWNFSAGLPSAKQNDFYSVALHEVGHVLGFGGTTCNAWAADTAGNGSMFAGANTIAIDNGLAALSSDETHWKEGTTSIVYGSDVVQEAAMDPTLKIGSRKLFTSLDMAALADIGWEVKTMAVPEPTTMAGLASLAVMGIVIGLRRRT